LTSILGGVNSVAYDRRTTQLIEKNFQAGYQFQLPCKILGDLSVQLGAISSNTPAIKALLSTRKTHQTHSVW